MAPSRPTIFLTDDDVRRSFDWREAVAALRVAYASKAGPEMFPPRTMARGDGLWLRALTGVMPDGGVLGAKIIVASMKNGRASYLVQLFDPQTAELVALLDGNSVTGFRTAATSAMAADVLAAPGPCRVAVIGSGFEAKNHVRALAELRALTSVTVFSPNPASRTRFIAELDDLDVVVGQAETARDAVAGADLIICAARSRDETPTLEGSWLSPGATIISIGSTLPEQRELDPVAIDRADLIVADMVHEVADDTGDMIAAAGAGINFSDKMVSLSDIIAQRACGRRNADEIILYKSVGAALQDIAVSAMCATRARAMGIGTLMPVTISPVQKGK